MVKIIFSPCKKRQIKTVRIFFVYNRLVCCNIISITNCAVCFLACIKIIQIIAGIKIPVRVNEKE